MDIKKFAIAIIIGALISLTIAFMIHTMIVMNKQSNDINAIKTALNLSTIK